MTTKKKPAAKAPAKPKADPVEFDGHQVAFADQLVAQLHIDRSVALAYAHGVERGFDLAADVSQALHDLGPKQLNETDADGQAKKLKLSKALVSAAASFLEVA